MQHSAQIGSTSARSQRPDRVPLAVGIDLRGIDRTLLDEPFDDESEQTLTGLGPVSPTLAADGINVSIGGMAMRASFVPPVGATLECSFECPPTGETVSAQGEVVWAERRGPDDGQFGVRFVELDTKSATLLRKLVTPAPANAQKADRPRAASIVIDGLGTSIEAELKLSDDSRIVLEQSLSFLQLGRGVEVTVPGRANKERGRIASVELRQSDYDVPRLVFGVLLDEPSERAQLERNSERTTIERFEDAASKLAPLFTTPAPKEPEPEVVAAQVSVAPQALRRPRELRPHPYESELTLDDATSVETRLDEIPGEPTKRASLGPTGKLFITPEPLLPVSAADSAPALCVDDSELSAAQAELPNDVTDVGMRSSLVPEPASDEEEPAPRPSEPDLAEVPSERSDAFALRVRNLPTHLRALFQAAPERLQGLRDRFGPGLREQAEYFDLPDAKSRALLRAARLRGWFVHQWLKLRSMSRASMSARPRHSKALRVQRATLQGIGPQELERSEPSRRARYVAIAFGVLGVCLGIYALAPRSGADRIKVPERVQPEPAAAVAPPVEEEIEEEPEVAPAPKRKLGRAREVTPAAHEANASQAVESASAAVAALSAPFGDAEVPNGRVFALRMNGPVQVVEGDKRDNGFTVRIPGRQALDRASPIAASHSAVQRAMILNRGGYAELTVEFAPGATPHYQVRGKENALEVTIERAAEH